MVCSFIQYIILLLLFYPNSFMLMETTLLKVATVCLEAVAGLARISPFIVVLGKWLMRCTNDKTRRGWKEVQNGVCLPI
jgi:hypothetical protein